MLSARTCRPPCLLPVLDSEGGVTGQPTWGNEPVDQRKKGFVSALNIRSAKSLSTRDARIKNDDDGRAIVARQVPISARPRAFRGGERWPRAPDETPPASASTTCGPCCATSTCTAPPTGSSSAGSPV